MTLNTVRMEYLGYVRDKFKKPTSIRLHPQNLAEIINTASPASLMFWNGQVTIHGMRVVEDIYVPVGTMELS